MFNIKSILYVFLISAFCYMPQNMAVFCSAYEYIHPKTKQRIMLFGDIHNTDIDASGTLSRFQKYTLLEEAKKCNAFIIAENINNAGYNPYTWASLLAFNALVMYTLIKNEQYTVLLSPLISGLLVSKLWYDQWLQTQKPDITLDNYIESFKKNTISDQIPFYGHTPLLRLVEDAHAHDIAAIDLEFRYHPVEPLLDYQCSQAPWFQKGIFKLMHLINKVQRTITDNKMRYQLTVQDYCDSNDVILKEINSYNDTEIGHTFYQQCIEQYNASYITKELRDIASDTPNYPLATVVSHIAKKYNKEMLIALREFSEHNKNLLDARIIHEILKKSSESCLFICTGIDHTLCLKTILKQLGYQEITAYGEESYNILQNAGIINSTSMQLKNIDLLAIDLQSIFAN